MRFFAQYWWLILLPVAIMFWLHSVRRTSRPMWIWILRIAGIALLLIPAIWAVTGNVQNQFVTIHLAGGWRDAVVSAFLGVAALVTAHRIAARVRPPAKQGDRG